MKLKYKVGDKVTIKPNLKELNREAKDQGYFTGGLNHEMEAESGRTCTISGLSEHGYYLEEISYFWCEYFLYPADKNNLFDSLIRGSITKGDYEALIGDVKGRVDT